MRLQPHSQRYGAHTVTVGYVAHHPEALFIMRGSLIQLTGYQCYVRQWEERQAMKV